MTEQINELPAPVESPAAPAESHEGAAIVLKIDELREKVEIRDITLRDESFNDAFGGAVRPADYFFETPDDGSAMHITQRANAANVLAEMGVPAALGNEMARRWNAAIAQGHQTDAQLTTGYRQAYADLERRHGAEGTEEILRLANTEVDKLVLQLPWLKRALDSTSLGNDTWLAETLANIAKARKPKR